MIQKECFEKEFIESRRSAIALYFCLKIQTFLELPKEMPFFQEHSRVFAVYSAVCFTWVVIPPLPRYLVTGSRWP